VLAVSASWLCATTGVSSALAHGQQMDNKRSSVGGRASGLAAGQAAAGSHAGQPSTPALADWLPAMAGKV